MPYIKVWLHFVWATKNREKSFDESFRQKVFDHIKVQAKENNIYIDSVNGYTDHIHCLISLGSDQTIAKIMQLIKGESSHWINKQKFIKSKFEWQDDYFVVSVSDSIVNRVRAYIRNQAEHHKHKSFQDEYDEFIVKHGFKRFIDSKS
jgi:putative transposase